MPNLVTETQIDELEQGCIIPTRKPPTVWYEKK